jgi:uncharacterized RmlC-like cupin family protein
MEIISRSDTIFVDKQDGTKVNYYITREYEVHYNEVDAGTEQQWHHHRQIDESIFMIAGSLQAMWMEGDIARSREVTAGDLVRVQNDVHTFANVSNAPARFVVFRMVPDGADKREIIKGDKVVDDVEAV